MKKITSVIMVAVTMVLCFALSACGNRYFDNYSATLMVEQNTTNTASVSFDTFKGRYVIRFHNVGDAAITYNATLEKGNVKVYYDYNGEKLSLFEIGDDGSIEGKTEAFTGNKTVYIIIESDNKSNEGSFSFALE